MMELPPKLAAEIQDEKDPAIKYRLSLVYRQAETYIEHSNSHLDIGTYDGFALRLLEQFADYIYTIDNDKAMLWEAINFSHSKKLIAENRLEIKEMDARNLQVEPNSFDSATIIEVFGAGFEGDRDEIARVFDGVWRALKPGGKLVFTIKNQAVVDLFEPMEIMGATKGTPMNREWLETEVLINKFALEEWYGQMLIDCAPSKPVTILWLTSNSSGKPQWNGDAFVPIAEAEISADKHPLYWIGSARAIS